MLQPRLKYETCKEDIRQKCLRNIYDRKPNNK